MWPKNLIRIVPNNKAHEFVGGMPTVAGALDLPGIAWSCGCPCTVSVGSMDELDRVLAEAKAKRELTFIEIKCALGAQDNLGRPAIPPEENRTAFMAALGGRA